MRLERDIHLDVGTPVTVADPQGQSSLLEHERVADGVLTVPAPDQGLERSVDEGRVDREGERKRRAPRQQPRGIVDLDVGARGVGLVLRGVVAIDARRDLRFTQSGTVGAVETVSEADELGAIAGDALTADVKGDGISRRHAESGCVSIQRSGQQWLGHASAPACGASPKARRRRKKIACSASSIEP